MGLGLRKKFWTLVNAPFLIFMLSVVMWDLRKPEAREDFFDNRREYILYHYDRLAYLRAHMNYAIWILLIAYILFL